MPRETSTSAALKFRVLCIENDLADRTAMQDYGWILGWDVHICASISEGLDLATKTRFDLIVYGLEREISAGFDIIAEVRTGGGLNAGAPVLFLTKEPFPKEMLQQVTRLGAAILQMKPLMLSRLKSVAKRFAETVGKTRLTGPF